MPWIGKAVDTSGVADMARFRMPLCRYQLLSENMKLLLSSRRTNLESLFPVVERTKAGHSLEGSKEGEPLGHPLDSEWRAGVVTTCGSHGRCRQGGWGSGKGGQVGVRLARNAGVGLDS